MTENSPMRMPVLPDDDHRQPPVDEWVNLGVCSGIVRDASVLCDLGVTYNVCLFNLIVFRHK